jgi:prepilin-type N-terminal cleavage/methylation domain-containing protein
MKTINSDMWQMAGDRKNTRMARGGNSRHPSPVTRHAPAFTLTELLVVISIIAVLAAFTVPVLSAVKRRQNINKTQAEMGQLQAAIDSYHAAYGFYPPGNGTNGLINQLYYELEGTTNDGTTYTTLDGAASIAVNPVNQVTLAFPNVGGFVNCNKPGSSEDTQAARNFLHELKPNQTGTVSNANNTVQFKILVGSAGGPDPGYQPMGVSGLNPWRYVSPGTNNPTSYDLWIQLEIGGKSNLICNWNKEVQINNNTWK